ncbi:MAG: TonB-dependent receptor [Candidatus Neomarinimicrobiota bacterium]
MLRKLIIYLVFVPLAGIHLLAITGSIVGVVQDQVTLQPLPGANVIIIDSELGAATDGTGQFAITDLPVGSYHVKALMMGYEPEVKLNVQVNPGRQTILTFDLPLAVLELEAVEVTRSYFKKEPDVVSSSRTVDYAEIRSDPGGVYDIQKMMQTLPAVVSAADMDNEIIVRGGAPGENLFIMDHMEIPNPNHFGYQGLGGGPVNMINTEFVDQVDLIAGAFPAKYGGKASSVMDIRLREGSRDEYNLDLDMNMSGLGMNAEGPLAGGRGSFLSSFKISYLDLVIKSIGMVAIPRYWSTQSKLIYDLNSSQQLIFNAIYGNDRINIEGEPSPQSRGAENVDVKGSEYAVGLSLKSLWSKNTYSRLTLYQTGAWWNYDVYRFDFDLSKDRYYYKNDYETCLALKGDLVVRRSAALEIRAGFQIKNMRLDYEDRMQEMYRYYYYYSNPLTPDLPRNVTDSDQFYLEYFPTIAQADSVVMESDTIWGYYHGADTVRAFQVSVADTFPSWGINLQDHFSTYQLFAQAKLHLGLRIVVNAGLHYFCTEYNDDQSLEPRIGLSYKLTEKTSLNGAFGTHYQMPAYALLALDESGKSLLNKHTIQYVAGVEHLFANDIRLTMEIYHKQYRNMPVFVSDTTSDVTDGGRELISIGEGYSKGFEFLLQKKLAEQFWGTVSYSHYIAQGRDPRYQDRRKYYNWSYDYRDVLTLSGGYKIEFHKKTWFRELKEQKWWSFVAWLPVAPADEWEIGIRYRYVGGKPYTPLTYNHQLREWFELPGQDYNTERLTAYNRFDIMIMQRHFFEHMSLTAFVNIMNVFNVDNIWDKQYNADGTREDVLQYKTFPVGGFMLEF